MCDIVARDEARYIKKREEGDRQQAREETLLKELKFELMRAINAIDLAIAFDLKLGRIKSFGIII